MLAVKVPSRLREDDHTLIVLAVSSEPEREQASGGTGDPKVGSASLGRYGRRQCPHFTAISCPA